MMNAGAEAVLRDPSLLPEDFIHFPFGARSQACQEGADALAVR